MLATSPRKRFDRLVELAERGPESRDALLGELHALLAEWPADYPAPMRDAFVALLDKVAREAGPQRPAIDAPALVHAARTMNGTFVDVLARALTLDAQAARELLNDPTGESLARACRNAQLDRATYSAIVILTTKDGALVDRLRAYDQA
jgi:hypothetical protein